MNPWLQPGSSTVLNKMQCRDAQPCQRSHTTQVLQHAKKDLAGRPKKEKVYSVFPSETPPRSMLCISVHIPCSSMMVAFNFSRFFNYWREIYRPWISHLTFFPSITYFCLILSDNILQKHPMACCTSWLCGMKGCGHQEAMDSPVQELCSACAIDLRVVLIVHPFH